MKTRITVLGAGFAGMELSTIVSQALGDDVQVTLIDASDAFVFGYSKLDLMFGHAMVDDVRLPYRRFVKPGVRLLRETVQAIDPEKRRVTTDAGTHDSDYLVVALGADYDFAATPGLDGAGEFYTVAGANRLREVLPGFSKGHALVGVCGAPYKCPPAPSECALMLHDYLLTRGVRDQCSITLVLPLPSPVPPSPETSKALIAAFADRDIRFMPNHRIASVDTARRVASLDDGSELPYDLFLGVPRHRAPAVVEASGMAEGGWVPKAGVFAEGAAQAVASALVSRIRGEGEGTLYSGAGTCYIEFGGGRIGRVDVDFFSGPKPTGTYHAPDVSLRADKEHFGASRKARWFGL